MRTPLFSFVLSCLATCPVHAQNGSTSFSVVGSTTKIELLDGAGVEHYRVSFDQGRTWHAPTAVEPRIMLTYAQFDPLVGLPKVAADLTAPAGSRQYLVQFRTHVFEAYLRRLKNLGVEVFHHMPYQAQVVVMGPELAQQVAKLPFVRWVGPVHPAYKIQAQILGRMQLADRSTTRRYNVVPLDKQSDRGPLFAEIERLGGKIENGGSGSTRFEASLDYDQLLKVARLDTVEWIDDASAPEEDMDLVRIFGGADYLESKGVGLQFRGRGITGHIMEGVYPNHPEFKQSLPHRQKPIGIASTSPSSHGTATCAVIFASGTSAKARGMMPEGQAYFTNYGYVYGRIGTRKTLVKSLMANQKIMFQTASWGYSRTTSYTSYSQEMDDLIFDLDIPITQSQSNAGATSNPRNSRPQAWAKNIISVGGIRHYDTLDTSRHKWAKSGSIGPASDGRIKPDLCGFYDYIYTAYGSSGYTQFGGTSGATPIVAGHIGLFLEIWTDGLLGYPMKPGGYTARFDNRPHFTTTKAVMINCANQYPFSGAGTDPDVMRQGFGFPSVRNIYDRRDTMLVRNELDVLSPKDSRRYWVFSKSGVPLRATMVYNDPAASPSQSIHRLNDLDLQVLAPDGTSYWGNNGLKAGNWNTPGGARDGLDTVENVFVKSPKAGVWTIDVIGRDINTDSHTETTAIDADFALVVSGISGNRDRTATGNLVFDMTTTGKGDLTMTLSKPNTSNWNEGFTLFSFDQTLPVGHGNILGVELDGLTLATLSWPVLPGDPVHFTNNTNSQLYPRKPYAFPAGTFTALRGFRLSAVTALVDKTGVVEVSNVASVQF